MAEGAQRRVSKGPQEVEVRATLVAAIQLSAQVRERGPAWRADSITRTKGNLIRAPRGAIPKLRLSGGARGDARVTSLGKNTWRLGGKKPSRLPNFQTERSLSPLARDLYNPLDVRN